MKTITPRQQQILTFVRDYSAEYGRAPSIREICTGCSISSTSVASYHLRRLEAAGRLERAGVVSRGLRVVGARYVMPGDTVHVLVDGFVVEAPYVVG